MGVLDTCLSPIGNLRSFARDVVKFSLHHQKDQEFVINVV